MKKMFAHVFWIKKIIFSEYWKKILLLFNKSQNYEERVHGEKSIFLILINIIIIAIWKNKFHA